MLKVFLLVIAFTAALGAQCKDVDFPSREGATAAPTRPTESFPVDPLQAGMVQLESGWTSAGPNAIPTMIRFGAWCGVELRWNASPGPNAGFGGNYFGGQYRFLRETKRRPGLAMGYTVTSAMRGHEITVMAAKTIHGFSIVSNASHFMLRQPAGDFNGKTELTLAVSHILKGRLGAVAEVYRDTRLNAVNAAYTNSTWALTYNVGRRIVIDSGVYIGLTHGPGAPGKSAFVGLTYALGALYAPRP